MYSFLRKPLKRIGTRGFQRFSNAWYAKAHQEINEKTKPRYNLELNHSEWSLMELDARISSAIENNLNGKPLQIPIIDIVSSELPGHIIGNHAVQCAKRRGMVCPKINWSPRFVTVQSGNIKKPKLPLIKGEKDLGMPDNIFSSEMAICPNFYGQAQKAFYNDSKVFWEDCFNLIQWGPATTVIVLPLSQCYPTVFGMDSIYILNETLEELTEGKKQLSLINWVPSHIIIARL